MPLLDLKMMRIVVHIPARLGSQRVSQKNLKNLNGRPLISYAIEAAKKSTEIADFYVNTESTEIVDVARSFGAQVYLRQPALAEEFVTQDAINYDFALAHQCDAFALLNPVNPLITSNEIDEAIRQFFREDCDSMISVSQMRLHAFVDQKPVNFDVHQKLPRTQDIHPVTVCNWAFNIWKRDKFLRHYEKNGYSLFVGKVGYYELPSRKSVKISTEEDFILAEALIRSGI